jgi:hypothetical protein
MKINHDEIIFTVAEKRGHVFSCGNMLENLGKCGIKMFPFGAL